MLNNGGDGAGVVETEVVLVEAWPETVEMGDKSTKTARLSGMREMS